MQEINLNSLKDKALDVDPDLRFMALEDFRKYLTSSSSSGSSSGNQYSNFSSRALEGFLPILFRLLSDHNSDVQSQAVKSFEPMIGYLTNDAMLSVVGQLYKLVLEENTKAKGSGSKPNFKSFTTSIPNMALRSMLSTGNTSSRNGLKASEMSPSIVYNSTSTPSQTAAVHPFDVKLSRSIVDLLLPQITKNSINIDAIELLFDVIKNLGFALSKKDIKLMSVFLIDLSFQETGIISKRAIAAYDALTTYIVDESLINENVVHMQQSFVDLKNETADIVRFQLYSVVFRNGFVLDPSLVQTTYSDAIRLLKLNELNVDTDEFDFDSLVKLNLARDEALNVINDLISSRCSIVNYETNILDIVAKFIQFNPFDDKDNDMDMDYEEDDIEFSDDENELGDDDENDGSWKLRSKACQLLQSLLRRSPHSLEVIYRDLFSLLPLLDSSELVSHEAIRTAKLVVELTVSPRNELQPLVTTITQKLLVKEKLGQFPIILQLIESLNKFEQTHLIQTVFAKFEELDLDTSGSLDYLILYRNVIDNSDDSGLPSLVVSYIAGDLLKSLNDKSFSIIIESLKIFSSLLQKFGNTVYPEQVRDLTDNLLGKVQDYKSYSSELILACINCLGAIIKDNLTDGAAPIIDTLWNCVTHESTVKPTLEVLYEFYGLDTTTTATGELEEYVVSKLNGLIISPDDSISYLSLTLLKSLIRRISFTETALDKTTSAVVKSISKGNKGNLPLSFEILAYLTETTGALQNKFDEFIDISVGAINGKLIDVNNEPFFRLFELIVANNADLFSRLPSILDLSLETSARSLATVCGQNRLISEIQEQENKLNICLSSKIAAEELPNLVFIVQFLGHCAEYVPLFDVLDKLFTILERGSNNLENEKRINSSDAEKVREAAAVSIGLLVRTDLSNRLSKLMLKYASKELNNYYLVSSLKVVVPKCNIVQLKSIWEYLWINVNETEFDHSLCSEFRNTGDLISELVLRDKSQLEYLYGILSNKPSLSSIYTAIVSVKHLISKLDDTRESLQELEKLILITLPSIDIVNIDIKQLIIGNLLTALHNKPQIILPHLNNDILPGIYRQLKAEVEFKKIIPMGPYKYVLDEGLEIRKLSYEFIYTLISLDAQTINEYNVDIAETAKNIIEQGLVDDQIDIIVLSSINLINFINNHESIFECLLIKDNGAFLSVIAANLKLQLGKKLGAKASAQDTENYQERIKSIIKLIKRISILVESVQLEKVGDSDPVELWAEFHREVKLNFVLFYNSTESK
ncbi:hypothetical protein G9P44_005204 [Scheffersomyces stipitis]|nr:hypothetical protein G9P44_005204 [Scheffersomyces stipitis]